MSAESKTIDLGDDLRAALETWHLEPLVSANRAVTGAMNETVIIGTTKRQVVLRRHRRTERSQIELEHKVIGHARRNGIPTPVAISTPTGDIIVDRDGVFYSLFEFARGQQLTGDQLTPTHAWSMGLTLSQIDDALADFPAPPRMPGTRHTVEETAATIERLLRCIEERPDHDQLDHWAEHHLRTKLLWLQTNPAPVWHTVPDVAMQMIHGDYQHTNLFFEDGSVTDVIDWDKTYLGWPAAEVVRTLDLSLRLRPELCDAMIKGYRSVRELSMDDLDLAAANYDYGQIHGHWLFEGIYLRDDDRLRQFLEPGPFVPFLDRWHELRMIIN